jgi:hypothetical protein
VGADHLLHVLFDFGINYLLVSQFNSFLKLETSQTYSGKYLCELASETVALDLDLRAF